MSWYIDSSRLTEAVADKDWWTTTYLPGEEVPVSGIFRCLGCGREDACNAEDPFPPQNHHQHTTDQGRIRWRLNVRGNTAGK
jgi:hypothetical protein